MKRSHSELRDVLHLPLPHPAHRTRSISAAPSLPSQRHDFHHLLAQVPALLTIIGPYLDLPLKLTQLPRLHRSFPVLPPACFRHDAVELSSQSLLLSLTASPARLALLRHVSSLSFTPQRHADKELFAQLVLPLFTPPHSLDFSHLRSLALSGEQQKNFTLSLIFSDPTAYPALRALRLSTAQPYPSTPNDRWDVSALSQLPALTDLTLSGVGLSPRAFLFLLCNLSLHSLDLSDRIVLTRFDADDHKLPADGVLPSLTLRTLLLPDFDPDEDSPLIDLVLAGLTQRCEVRQGEADESMSSGDDRRQGLAHLQLACTKLSDCTLGTIASISSLDSLDLICSPLVNPLPLYDAATHTPRLPLLRHLCLTGVSDCEDEIDAQAVSAMLGAHLGFLLSYSRQLRILELDVLEVWPYTGEDVRPIVMVALQCRQLRALRLSGERQSHATEKPEQLSAPHLLLPQGPLSHLHSLYFDSLPIDEADLAIVLEHCPSLQDCRLQRLGHLAVEDALLILGSKCPQLRRVEFALSDTAAGSTTARPIEAGALQPALFSCLSVLSITANFGNDSVVQTAFIANLVALLRSATKLHYLRLDVPLDLRLLAPFASLSSLHAFRAWRRLPTALHRHFQSGLGVRQQRPQVLCREEVLSGSEMERAERARCGWSDEHGSEDTYMFAEAGGRVAFFAALGQPG